MFTAFKQLWYLCFFRIKPEDLPYASSLAYIIVFLDWCILLPGIFKGKISVGLAFMLVLVYNGIIALVLQWILNLRRQEGRFLKMFIALTGTHLIFQMMVFVLSALVGESLWLHNVVTLFGIWGIIVNAYIFQYGFGVGRLAAVGFAFVFIIATMTPIAMILELTNH